MSIQRIVCSAPTIYVKSDADPHGVEYREWMRSVIIEKYRDAEVYVVSECFEPTFIVISDGKNTSGDEEWICECWLYEIEQEWSLNAFFDEACARNQRDLEEMESLLEKVNMERA